MFIIDDSFDISDSVLNAGIRGTIPRDKTVQPLRMAAVSFPVIPMEEWPERIAEAEAKKANLHWIRRTGNSGGNMPVKDQNGQGFCHTADTEVLTDKGYVKWPEYNWVDKLATVNPASGSMEYQLPMEKHIYEYDGEMVHSTNRRVDFAVTPDHQMYVRKWDEQKRTLSDKYSFVKAGDLGWYTGLMASPKSWNGTEFVELEIPGDRRYDGDDFIALLGLIVSDGYAGGTEKTKNWVSFASFRETTIDAMRALAHRVGFHESPSRKGVFIRYDAGYLANWVRTHCYTSNTTGSQNKCVPAFIKEASMRQIKKFLYYFDDRNRDGSQFYTTSRKLADDLQELHMKIGSRVSVANKDAKTVKFEGNASGEIKGGPSFVLTVSTGDSLCLDKKKHIETDRYKGLVYCAAVPNHTLITRRNGTSLISSNCWAYSTVRCAELLRAKANLAYESLSAHSVACKIYNFVDRGAWGALSQDFIIKNGIVPERLWPAKSMNRAYDTSANWQEALKYRISESWADAAADVWDRNLSKQQIGTQLLLNNPGAFDYNWWGHSVCGHTLRDVYPNRSKTDFSRYGVEIDNSWTPSWGEDGSSVLVDSKAWPDGCTFSVSVVAS